MYSEFDYKGLLCHWVDDHNTMENDVEVYYSGKYYFKIEERLYYIDLRCGAGDLASHVFCRMFTHFKTGELFYEDILIDNPDVENRRYTIQDFRGICERFVALSAFKYEERIKKLENGRVLIDDDYWNGMNISNFDSTPEYWPWSMIDQCGKEFRNERFLLTAQTCPTCGSSVVKSKFCTCPESWHNLAGREGWVWFCPKCKKQLQERIILMN